MTTKLFSVDLQTAKDWYNSTDMKLRKLALRAYNEDDLSMTETKLIDIIFSECNVRISSKIDINEIKRLTLNDKAIQAVIDYFVFCEDCPYENVWAHVLAYMNPSIEFIEDYIKHGYLTYEEVLLSGNYAEFIHAHVDEINWKNILSYNIGFNIIMEFYNNFNVEDLIKNQIMWNEDIDAYVRTKLNLTYQTPLENLTQENWLSFWSMEHNEYVIYYLLQNMKPYNWGTRITTMIDNLQNVTSKFVRDTYPTIFINLKDKYFESLINQTSEYVARLS